MNNTYLHNFACWAAARSIQNPNLSDTKTKKIRLALEKIDIQQFVSDPELLLDFPKTHKKLISKLIKVLNWDEKTRFGVAAKIIAIYFKVTLVISRNAPREIIHKIYPPLDSFNLKQLGIRNLNWTNIDKTDFNFIIEQLEIYCKNNNLTFLDFESKNKLGG
jgi:hypothetical protein